MVLDMSGWLGMDGTIGGWEWVTAVVAAAATKSDTKSDTKCKIRHSTYRRFGIVCIRRIQYQSYVHRIQYRSYVHRISNRMFF